MLKDYPPQMNDPSVYTIGKENPQYPNDGTKSFALHATHVTPETFVTVVIPSDVATKSETSDLAFFVTMEVQNVDEALPQPAPVLKYSVEIPFGQCISDWISVRGRLTKKAARQKVIYAERNEIDVATEIPVVPGGDFVAGVHYHHPTNPTPRCVTLTSSTRDRS
jgi:hypothetical protein